MIELPKHLREREIQDIDLWESMSRKHLRDILAARQVRPLTEDEADFLMVFEYLTANDCDALRLWDAHVLTQKGHLAVQ